MNKICFLTIALSFFLSSPVMADLKCSELASSVLSADNGSIDERSNQIHSF